MLGRVQLAITVRVVSFSAVAELAGKLIEGNGAFSGQRAPTLCRWLLAGLGRLGVGIIRSSVSGLRLLLRVGRLEDGASLFGKREITDDLLLLICREPRQFDLIEYLAGSEGNLFSGFKSALDDEELVVGGPPLDLLGLEAVPSLHKAIEFGTVRRGCTVREP